MSHYGITKPRDLPAAKFAEALQLAGKPLPTWLTNAAVG